MRDAALIIFQVVVIAVIIVSLLGAIGERKDKKLQQNMTAICVASVVSYMIFLITFF